MIASNDELSAAGNIAWTVARSNYAAIKPATTTVGGLYTGGGETKTTVTPGPEGTTVETIMGTKEITATAAQVPPERELPHGKYLTIQRDAEGHIIGLDVTKTLPTAAQLAPVKLVPVATGEGGLPR